jgi:membrane protein involved in colicin uptake
VLLLGLALVAVLPQVVFGRSNQQQEQQQREQQEREQQQRDQQQREQQEREQQQREQQQRAQQQRDQQQREQQERMQQQQHSSSDFPAPSSNASSEASSVTADPPATDVKRSTSDIHPLDVERKINSASPVKATATKDHASSPLEPDLRRKLCIDGSCQTCPAGIEGQGWLLRTAAPLSQER